MEVKRSFSGIVLIILVSFFFTASFAVLAEARIPDFAQKQKKAVVVISIHDRNGNEVASGSGFIVDSNGIVATNCKIISQWLEDVEYALIVRTEGKGSYPINKLISYNRRHDIALFEIKAEGLAAVQLLPDYRSSEYIKRQIVLHKKLAKKELPQKPLIEAPKPLIEPQKPEIPVEIRKPAKKTEVKKDNAEEYFMKGLKYERSNQYADAVEAYKKALKIKPDYMDAYVNLGVLYYKLGKYSDAIDAYKHAVKIKPDFQAIYNKLGTVYIVTGKYSAALDTLEHALGIDSRNPDTHFNLGIAYYLNGDKDAAYEEYIILNKLDARRAEDLFDLIYR
ncbi:MAG: tetratricopeptide repeat protein [Thermodesulfovibrionales bacterium]|jgi:tetratricopeptide (TPR) repeat protein|nr:tetratricopeptide repeat protein [Thermodesulfovibrionales bacterium]